MPLRRLRYHLPAYLRLRAHFEDWKGLACAHFLERPLGEARLRGGHVISHPPGRRGLAETVIELWAKCAYFPRQRYSPAPDDIVVDAGANVGLFSIWLLGMQPALRLIAIEPAPENLQYLEPNLARFGERVAVIPAALGAKDGVGYMDMSTERSLDYRLAEEGVPVQVTTLETILSTIPGDRSVALLKLDIEGGEASVVDAASPDVWNRIQRIALEYHDHVVPGTYGRLMSTLAPYYEITVLEEHSHGYGLLWCSSKHRRE